jgi:signal transduction histidine kinase
MNTTLSSADFATQSRRSMRKIISLVCIAITMFVAIFLYGLQSSVKSAEQLTAIKDVYFPVLEQIDASIVNVDRIEAFMVQAVMTGEKEELSKAREVYSRTVAVLMRMHQQYPEQQEVIAALQEQFEGYFNFAENTTQMLLANGGKDELGQTVQMNELLLELRKHITAFRESSYQNFLSTLDESGNTSELNFYISIGAGAINLLFLAILVFFIRLLNRQNNSVSHSLDQVATLLNNCGQGFFSFGADMKIVGEYSQACVEFLGQVPTGQDAAKVLFPFSDNKCKLMRSCIADALQAKTPYLVNMFLELIPVELVGNGKVLKAQYISIKTGFMVVMTDITAEVNLKTSVELENKRTAMILAAVTDGPEFISTIDDFVSFCKAGPEPWLTQEIANLYRAIHTYKGSFNQFRFTHVPRELHQVEAFLQGQPFLNNLLGDASSDGVASIVFSNDWIDLLNCDIQVVTTALGDNYFSRGGFIPLQIEHARAFEQLANELLSTKIINLEHEQLLKELSEVRYISLHKELTDFSKLVQQVAVQLDKELVPLEINGDDVHLDPDIYRQFLLTLGHVMRNAVDHGIEDPDSRYEKGKSEAGTIRCATSRIANEFELIIQDDGAGINEAALRLRASEKQGINVDSLTLADLVFADGLSSRETATELSGRGVGMAAVRAEVLKLGGAVTVETVAEEGTRFIFRIPIIKDIAA